MRQLLKNLVERCAALSAADWAGANRLDGGGVRIIDLTGWLGAIFGYRSRHAIIHPIISIRSAIGWAPQGALVMA